MICVYRGSTALLCTMICVYRGSTALLRIYCTNFNFFCHYKLSQQPLQSGMLVWIHFKFSVPTAKLLIKCTGGSLLNIAFVWAVMLCLHAVQMGLGLIIKTVQGQLVQHFSTFFLHEQIILHL
jgi:hypothetical protein